MNTISRIYAVILEFLRSAGHVVHRGVVAASHRVVGVLPSGVRDRLGTRRSAVVGVAALGLLGVSLGLSLVSATTGGATPAGPVPAAVAPSAPSGEQPAPAPVPAQEPLAGVSPAQSDNAKAIAAAAAERGLPEKAVTVGIATALQESNLENINYGDRDSVGLFQQRPSQGWGSVEQIMDPQYSAGKFYDGLKNVEGWENMRVTDAAQTVQRSGFPEAYEKWLPLATDLTHGITGK